MSREPKTPQGSQEVTSGSEASSSTSSSTPLSSPGRREYKAPRLKKLGSVRDLTLGSPRLPFGDGRGGFQRGPM